MREHSKSFDPKRVRSSGGDSEGISWDRLTPWAYGVAGSLLVALMGVIFWPVFEKVNDLHVKKTELQQKQVRLQVASKDLHEEIIALGHDPLYVERMSRDTLNVARPGETVFRFNPYKTDEK